MKKFIILSILVSLTYNLFCQTQTTCDSIIINTGFNHQTNSPFNPGSSYNPIMDPYWRVVSMPTGGANSCVMPNYNVGGPSYVVNDLTDYITGPLLNDARAISFQSTNSLPCNNPSPSYDSIILEYTFCINSSDSIIISGSLVFDDAVCMQLLGPNNLIADIPLTYHSSFLPSQLTNNCNQPISEYLLYNRTRVRPTSFLFNGFLSSGIYKIRINLRNLGSALCSVRLLGTVKSQNSQSLNCSYCGPSLLAIRKYDDLNDNGLIDATDGIIENWVFNVSEGGNQHNNLLTDSYGYVYVPDIPLSGTISINEDLTAGYELIQATLNGDVIDNISLNSFQFEADSSVLYQVEVLNKKINCECNTNQFIQLIEDSTDTTTIACNQTFDVLECGKTYKIVISDICTEDCPSEQYSIRVTKPDGTFWETQNSDLSFIPNMVGQYDCIIQTMCNQIQCNRCTFAFNQISPCPITCPCPETISTTVSNVQISSVLHPNYSTATANLLLTASGNYNEVRANVVDFQLYAVDDQGKDMPTCLQCYNFAQSWCSIISGKLGSTANIPIINGTVTNHVFYSPTSATQNPREIVFTSNSPLLLNNKPLQIRFHLPGISPIACCHLKANVTLKITYRNIDCVECTDFISGIINIEPRQESKNAFTKPESKKIRQKQPSVNNYGINDDGIK